ncbi:hypothetical protein GWI33_022334 [Rhynchophorus ferrugineus]|uniref:Uncharacterized protein n=1 Tax=Rhynchophorus ferrugineus TaxID=354439 RepID=A0A834HN49_RHYFE|nr:hypothetical protein GWI33_022334 [Rhynchophorus ferrugineus]
MEPYEDLRFQLLNLEHERFKLLQELQYILEDSRKEIAEEYNNLQKKIAAMEGGSVSLHQLSNVSSKQDINEDELQNILVSFRNVAVVEVTKTFKPK